MRESGALDTVAGQVPDASDAWRTMRTSASLLNFHGDFHEPTPVWAYLRYPRTIARPAQVATDREVIDLTALASPPATSPAFAPVAPAPVTGNDRDTPMESVLRTPFSPAPVIPGAPVPAEWTESQRAYVAQVSLLEPWLWTAR
jgi:hypothetical protein